MLVVEPHDVFEVPAELLAEIQGDVPTESPEDSAPDEPRPDDPRLVEARRRTEQLLADDAIRIAFQPIVDLANKEVIGFEALARFPGDAEISPHVWFAEAAEVGLQIDIEMAAIRRALRDLEHLPADAFISLNVSPLTAGSTELRDALAEVEGSRVVLEITESAAAEGYDKVMDAIGELRASGVRIALDDTGSGSVSFSNLFDIHADIIKIDIEVTRGIESDPMKEAMAVALKSLADRSGALSLAEGIETEEELALLRSLSVGAGQGYLFGHPESMSE